MSTPTKVPYSTILPKALHLLETLRTLCRRVELAGSLRRQRPQIGDIEIVAIPIPPLDLFGDAVKGSTPLDSFLAGHNVEFVKNGERYKQFEYGRYTVDLFLPKAETWGSVFTIRTGSADFSHWLVTAHPGVRFHEGRLYAEGRLLDTPEEEDVFAALGLAYIPPQDRHGPIADPLRVEPVWRYAC